MNGVINYRIDLWTVFIFLGIVQALFLCVFFFSTENRKVEANVWQGIFLVSVAANILEIFLMYTGYIVHCFYLVDFSEPFALLIGPSLYFIVVSLIEGKVQRREYWHLLPALLYALYHIAFMALPEDAKYNAWIASYHPELPFKEFTYPYDSDFWNITHYITEIVLISIFVYSILSTVKVITAFHKKSESFLHPKSTTFKILRANVSQLLIAAVVILVVKINNPRDTGDHIFATYVALTIYLKSFSVMRNSGFFKPASLDEPQKYKTSSLTQEQLQSTIVRLKQIMEKEKPFLNSSFSLPDLAQRLSISVHALSQVINEGLNKTFFELTGEYRVEEAKRLLKEQINVKVEEIAEQVGYNSKSSFTTVFKKFTGKTPGEYRNEA